MAWVEKRGKQSWRVRYFTADGSIASISGFPTKTAAENKADTLYEDVLMPPGFTHDPFFTVGNDRSFSYPWHRYYADTDCIWMAVELHPL